MAKRSWGIAVLSLGAGLSPWMLLAAPDRLLGVDTGWAGFGLLVIVTSASLYGLSRLPREPWVRAASPGECMASINSGSALIANGDGLVDSRAAAAASAAGASPGTGRVERSLMLSPVAWAVVSSAMALRWKKTGVQQDERDREIAAKAVGRGRSALSVRVIDILVALAVRPPRRLQWATPARIVKPAVVRADLGLLRRRPRDRHRLSARPPMMRASTMRSHPWARVAWTRMPGMRA